MDSTAIALTYDEIYSTASKVQLVSWELMSRVVAARNMGAGVPESDIRLLVGLWRECEMAERRG